MSCQVLESKQSKDFADFSGERADSPWLLDQKGRRAQLVTTADKIHPVKTTFAPATAIRLAYQNN